MMGMIEIKSCHIISYVTVIGADCELNTLKLDARIRGCLISICLETMSFAVDKRVPDFTD
jgi:hypothetical protein